MKHSNRANFIIILAICSLWSATPALAESHLINKAKDIVNEVGSKINSSLEDAQEYVDDSLLTAKVKGVLIDAGEIKGHPISVTTREGVVSLQGIVATKQQAQRAVLLAQNVAGVKYVNDLLSYTEEEPQQVASYFSDTLLTAEIKIKLLIDPTISSRYVHVETHNGTVMLSGYVTSQEQLQRIAGILNTITGAKAVYNNLAVKPL